MSRTRNTVKSMYTALLLELVSLIDCVAVQEDSLMISTLGLRLLLDVASGSIGNLEHTLHGGQIILLAQPL